MNLNSKRSVCVRRLDEQIRPRSDGLVLEKPNNLKKNWVCCFSHQCFVIAVVDIKVVGIVGFIFVNAIIHISGLLMFVFYSIVF
jgi:hypothetical protein